MNPEDYLAAILAKQTFADDDQELSALRDRREQVRALLGGRFSSCSPSIRQAGSMAKGTMIREAYDLDMTCYFPEGEQAAGATLKDIFENVERVLGENYHIQRKASAIRLRAASDWSTDLHIDVVPGRFIDSKKSDVFLYRTTPDKARLKTNLQTHVDHIRESGVRKAIRLLKLWRVRNGLASAKTFVLELLVVKLLEEMESEPISEQLTHVLSELKERASALSVEDPANSGNDLTPTLDSFRHLLSSAADSTLAQVQSAGWEGVFGTIQASARELADREAALRAAVASVSIPSKPYRYGP